MAIADVKGRMLFELRPDLFPEGYLTEAETQLWAKYYEDKRQRHG